MVRRKKEDVEKTRESLLDAAEVVFLRRGVSSASLDEIAREAGLTRGALYWHFEDKKDIFRAMHERVKLPLDIMFEQLTGGDDPLQGLKAMCMHIFHSLETDVHARNVFTIMRMRYEDFNCAKNELAQEKAAKRAQVHAKFTHVFEQIARQHPLAEGVSPTFAATALHCFVSGVLWDYLQAPELMPLKEYAQPLVDGFFRSILR